LSNFDFSSEDSSSSEEDENVNYKKKEDDFTGLCLMAKGRSSRNNSDFDSDFDVSNDLIYDGLSSKVVKLEDALCSQDKLLCRVFHENKDLNLRLENSFTEIASLQSMHNDMSANDDWYSGYHHAWTRKAQGGVHYDLAHHLEDSRRP
jgi:hypothetical protein